MDQRKLFEGNELFDSLWLFMSDSIDYNAMVIDGKETFDRMSKIAALIASFIPMQLL